MARLGASVTLFPVSPVEEAWPRVYRDLPSEIEIMVADGIRFSLGAFLRERSAYYDIIFISRAHNMRQLLQIFEAEGLRGTSRLVYDVGTVSAIRTAEKIRVLGEGDIEAARKELQEEFRLSSNADEIICVSEMERRYFLERDIRMVHVLGHAIESKLSKRTFEERSDILFTGAMNGADDLDEDSLLWFAKSVLPLIRARSGLESVRLVVVGQNNLRHLSILEEDPSVEVFRSVEDATPYYERAKVFVTPHRFVESIPMQAYEAAARGVPIVANDLVATELGWLNEELMTAPATDPESFADQCVRLYIDKELWSSVRARALIRIQQDCAPASFDQALRKIITLVSRPIRAAVVGGLATTPSPGSFSLLQRESG